MEYVERFCADVAQISSPWKVVEAGGDGGRIT